MIKIDELMYVLYDKSLTYGKERTGESFGNLGKIRARIEKNVPYLVIDGIAITNGELL